MTKQIDKIAFEFWAGVGCKSDLEDWAEDQLKKDSPHPDACELFNLSNDEAKEKSIWLANEILGFSPTSELGEKWAKELLTLYCKKLLNEEVKPIEFCNLVNQFDGGFLNARDIGEGLAYYPEWLGELWNCCDWCDESWLLSNSPHLAEEAKKVQNQT